MGPQPPGFRIDWTTTAGALTALEPTLAEVARHVTALAAAYNDPANAPLLGHAAAISETEVLDHYEAMLEQGAHTFLLFRDDALAGDGDIRGIADGAGEFAFLIAAPAAQGKGLGTAFATMIHAFAFTHLPVERLYASITPANVASRRVLDKLGYELDATPVGRGFAEDAADDVLRLDRSTFVRLHGAAMAQVQIAMR